MDEVLLLDGRDRQLRTILDGQLIDGRRPRDNKGVDVGQVRNVKLSDGGVADGDARDRLLGDKNLIRLQAVEGQVEHGIVRDVQPGDISGQAVNAGEGRVPLNDDVGNVGDTEGQGRKRGIRDHLDAEWQERALGQLKGRQVVDGFKPEVAGQRTIRPPAYFVSPCGSPIVAA